MTRDPQAMTEAELDAVAGRWRGVPIVFDLPTPPSANALWRNVGGKTLVASGYRDWKRLAGYEALKYRPPTPIKHPCALEVRLRQVPNGDADNRIKAAADLMQAVGAVANDKLFHDVRCLWDETVPRGRCLVTISPIAVRK